MIELRDGEDVPAAIGALLVRLQASRAVVRGFGHAEDVLLGTPTEPGAEPRHRALGGACALSPLDGAMLDPTSASPLRLFATVAREGELGLEVAAGELLAARARGLVVHVTSFHSAPATAAPSPNAVAPAVPAPAGHAQAAPPAQAAAAAPAAASSSAGNTAFEPGALLPPKPLRKIEEGADIYPEPEDRVSHFHFGECTVVSSDGERIRLRQDRDGRIREVALEMLKIEAPVTDPEGRRLFRLSRKL